MSLQFITGTSGQGKTTYLIQKVISEAEANPNQNYYVIVPEQYSLEMQRGVVESHPRHGFLNIDIISFHRLAYRVFDECGYQPAKILEDLGVAMMLEKILAEHGEELQYFKRSLKKRGFIDELKSILIESISYGVTWQDMRHAADKLELYPILRYKMQELSLIFQYFEQETEGRYMVTEQILDVLAEMIDQSALIQDGIFFFDGYTGFTPIQNKVLEQMLQVSKKLYITVNIDYAAKSLGAGEDDLFLLGSRTIRSLMGICRKDGILVEDTIDLTQETSYRFMDRLDMNHMEKYLFRGGKKEIYKEEVAGLHICACSNPDKEAEYILHKIESMIRKSYRDGGEKLRYRDFAILTGHVDDYAPSFSRVAEMLEIPLFLDVKKKLSYHPGLETIRSLFHLAKMDYSYESVFRYLKSGMSGLSEEETDYLENYVFGTGIRGLSMWKNPFYRKMKGIEQEQLETINLLRERMVEETGDFVSVVTSSKATVKDQMTALYQTLKRLHYRERLENYADQAAAQADYVREREYRSLFAMLVDLMDKLVGIFGQEILPAAEVGEIFDAGMDALGIGVVPLTMDQLILGDLKRTRLSEIRYLFVAGMNDGLIPPALEDTGILLDHEKAILLELGLKFSDDLLSQAAEDEFYMYQAFCRPSKGLYFSYSLIDKGGSQLRPSVLLRDFQNMFPKLGIRIYGKDEKRAILNPEDSRDILSRDLYLYKYHREALSPVDKKVLWMLLKYYENDPETREMAEKLWTKKDQMRTYQNLSQEVALEIYGPEFAGSVTQLEEFAECPYKYYCDYGLRLEPREEFKVNGADLGTLFHAALEAFSREVESSSYTWKDLPDKEEGEFIKNALYQAVDEKMSDLFHDTARDSYRLQKVERIFTKTIQVLRKHLQLSDFEPDAFELTFGKDQKLDASTLTLSQGVPVHLEGKIDRVDVYEEDDQILLKIIDYKSGSRQFKLCDLYQGIELQLVLYMKAAQEIYSNRKKKTVIPAGFYFYQIKDPMTDASEAEDKLYNYTMSGYTNKDPVILEHFEHVKDDAKQYAQANIKFTPTHRIHAASKLFTTEDFYQMEDYSRQKVKEIGERIYRGEIAPYPYRQSDRSACTYCQFKSVCGFDDRLPGYRYRDFGRMSDKQAYALIKGEDE